MPFTLEPLEVTNDDGESVVRGRLLSGSYFGPEAIVLTSQIGEQLSSHVHSHVLEHPEAWPVLPEHARTIIILRIPALPRGFEVASVTGLGAVALASQREDISAFLDDPYFWALQAALHLASNDVEDPGLEWFGIEPKKLDAWYVSQLGKKLESGVNLYLRVPLKDDRYVEFEMAGGIEYQDRVWIGRSTGAQRVLLGYHSGHFSLPALRIEEVAWLAEQTDMAASNLLWLSTTYLAEEKALPPALAQALASHLPGLQPGVSGAVASATGGRLVVPGVSWTRDPQLGWVNNWQYSQRNPQSGMSILKPGDFDFIEDFFD